MADKMSFGEALKLGKGKSGSAADADADPLSGDGDDGGADAPMQAAAKDLIAAVKDGDAQGVADALETAIMHVMMKQGT